MTRVDFHFNAPDKLQYGCRLVRKIYRARHKVLVWCDDKVRLAEFDRMLWTFSQHDFIPHVAAGDPLAAETPVLLAHAEAAETASTRCWSTSATRRRRCSAVSTA